MTSQDLIDSKDVTFEKKVCSQLGRTRNSQKKKTPRFMGASLTSKDESESDQDLHELYQNENFGEIAGGSSVAKVENQSKDSLENVF